MPRAMRLYLVGTMAGALVAIVVAAFAWPPDGNSPLGILVFVLAAIALREPIRLNRKTKITLEDAITFAGALLLSPAVAMLAAGGSTLVALRFRSTKWYERGFNAAKAALAVGIAGALYHMLAAVPSRDIIDPIAAVAAGAAKYLTSATLVDLAVAFQLRRSPFAKWGSRRRTGAVPALGLHLFGMLGAVAAAREPWVLVLLLVPTAAMFLLLRESDRARSRAGALLQELADLADLRDPYGRAHARDVAALAERLASRLRFEPDQVALVRDCARLQNLGLLDIAAPHVAIDDHALRQHAELAERRVARIPNLAEHALIVGAHHEQPDGNGYPRGLRGREVPLEASLICLAEAYVALARRDGAALSDEEIRAELERGRGSRWHEAGVDALLALLDEESQPQSVVVSPARAG